MRYEIEGNMDRVLYRHRLYAYSMMIYATVGVLLLALLRGPALMLQGKGFEVSWGFQLFDTFSDDEGAVYRFEVAMEVLP